MGVLEGEEWKKEAERIFKETMGEMLPNLLKSINLHIKETYCTLSRINSKQSTFRHIIIKFTKVKDNDKFWKQQEKNNLPCKRDPQ